MSDAATLAAQLRNRPLCDDHSVIHLQAFSYLGTVQPLCQNNGNYYHLRVLDMNITCLQCLGATKHGF